MAEKMKTTGISGEDHRGLSAARLRGIHFRLHQGQSLNRATRINDLLAEWRGQLAGRSTTTPLRVLELLAANPFLTITGAARHLKLAFTTSQRAIERLEHNGIVQAVSDAKRDRVYCARVLLDILEEPAHIVSSNAE
jgi:Fic family protein